MKSLIITIVLLLSLCSCGSKNGETDPYYTDHGDWDDIRFPLIKPYEALCLNGSHDWIVQTTQNSESFFSAPSTKKLNIVKGIILLYNTKTILNGVDAKEAWFVLAPKKHIEKSFGTYSEYLRYLPQLGIKNEPKLYDIDNVSRYFGDHDTIDWRHIDRN
jgi:hypothetical protein